LVNPESIAKIHCRLNNVHIDRIINDVDNACNLGYPLLEQLINSHPGFQPSGEKIGILLQRRIV